MIVAAIVLAFGFQTPAKPKAMSQAEAFDACRFEETKPSFELAKVERLVAHIQRTENTGEGHVEALPSKLFRNLSTKAKFTYCMIHDEVYSQNCDAPFQSPEDFRRIYGNPLPYSESDWSDRQRAFMHDHRREVVELVRSTIRTHDHVGPNLKDAVIELEAYELIPDLVAAYAKTHIDHTILSVFCVLMRDGKFQPFLKSATYRKLYGPQSSNQSFIVANTANQKLTIDRAMAYYRSRNH